MKYIYPIITLFCFFNVLTGQSLINNHWQLGLTDLDFSGTGTVANITVGGNYGTASLSDTFGNLLFYTNGKKVWNKSHSIMTNGTNIVNALEEYDFINTVIVPNPGDSMQYYIISSVNRNCLCFGIDPTEYYYSIVEFDVLNPLGIVKFLTSGVSGLASTDYSKIFPTINNDLYFGPLTVAKSDDGLSYWVIAQSGATIHSYKIDNNGLNLSSPVISSFTNTQIYDLGVFGAGGIAGIEGADFKISPDNLKLIGLQYSRINGSSDPDNDLSLFKNTFYTLDFNSNTGQFSNYQLLTGHGKMIYEFEISSNSENLYFIRKKHPYDTTVTDGEVVVKDLVNYLTPVRVLNEFNSANQSSKFSFIQRDRHSEIQISSIFSDNNRNLFLHKIEDQNSFANSSVKVDNLSLNGTPIGSLPQLIPFEEEVFCSDLNLISETHTGEYAYIDYNNITTTQNYVLDNITQDISMYAQNNITLSPNTYMKLGIKFLAAIEDCSSTRPMMRLGNGMEQIEEKTSFEVILNPNPASTEVSIKTNQQIKKVVVFSMDGYLVYEKEEKSSLEELKIDVSNFKKGIYLFKLTNIHGDKLFKRLVIN